MIIGLLFACVLLLGGLAYMGLELLPIARDLAHKLDQGNQAAAELVRLETLKQTQRSSGRDVLRERLKERIAQAAATRAKG